MHFRLTSWLAGFSLLGLAACTGQIPSERADGTLSGSGSGSGATGGSGGSGGGGGENAGGTAGNTTVAEGIELQVDTKKYRVIRLTSEQWARSVQDILRLAAPSGLESTFEGIVAGTTDFTNNGLLLGVTSRAWGDFQTAAETLAEQVTATDAALANVYSTQDPEDFIRTVGRRAYRRPLTETEVTTYLTLWNAGTAMSGTKSTFAKGAAIVIRALLQSPHFLYRLELTPAGTPLDGYEIAAKLSLWLRNTTPSDALLDAAPTLTTADAVASLAQTMMAESTAIDVMRRFHSEYLDFDRYDTLSKLNVPNYSQALNAEYKEASFLFFDKIFTQNLGLREILTSTMGFVGPGTAPLYGLPAVNGFVEQDLGPQRAGYFSQLGYLTLNAINDEPDSIHRGVTINVDVLCAPLGPPAADIPPVPPLKENQTNRERIMLLTAGCGGECHNSMINPVGFAFEHFDGMGQYQETEGGLPIDSSGSYLFTEGEKTFANNVELMTLMANGDQAHLCYSKKLASFALQRDIVVSDLPLLKALAAVSKATGGSLQNTMLELVKNDAFRLPVVGGAQ